MAVILLKIFSEKGVNTVGKLPDNKITEVSF